MEIDNDIDVGLGSDSSTSTDDILEATRQASEGPSTTSSSIEVTSVIDSRGGLVRVHNCLPTTDTDWFACPQCFKGFKHLNSLRDHLEMKHGIMETDDSGEEDDGNNDQFMTLIDRCPEVDLTSYDMGRRLVVLDSPIDGLGLFTGTFLPKGELVIEYTGEVITNIQAVRRQYSCENHAVKPFIMKIGKLLWDATAYGNCSKYMNNSCEPNCKAETIEIHGKNRCLIFTTRDVEIGEELTFDYKFTSDILVPCTCQASTCRRFLNCNLGNLLGDEEVAALASSF